MTKTPEQNSAEATAPETEVSTESHGDAAAEGSGSEVSALEDRVATLEQEKKDNYERLLRATADLDNFRKRSRRELEDGKVEARARVLRDILPVIDNLERAVSHAETTASEGTQGIIDGVKLVMRQFEQALTKNEVKLVEAEGQAFDPNVHEAMSQIATADAAPGTVIQVLQKGYVIGERLLRPALVVVAKAPPVEEPAAGSNGKSAEADIEVEVEADDGSSDDSSSDPN